MSVVDRSANSTMQRAVPAPSIEVLDKDAWSEVNDSDVRESLDCRNMRACVDVTRAIERVGKSLRRTRIDIVRFGRWLHLSKLSLMYFLVWNYVVGEHIWWIIVRNEQKLLVLRGWTQRRWDDPRLPRPFTFSKRWGWKIPRNRTRIHSIYI